MIAIITPLKFIITVLIIFNYYIDIIIFSNRKYKFCTSKHKLPAVYTKAVSCIYPL